MTIKLEQFVQLIQSQSNSLLLGSGSSIPSGAPSVDEMREILIEKFAIKSKSMTLPEIASIIEGRTSRKTLITALREQFIGLEPSEALLTLPLVNWKTIYTTNYDELIEEAYRAQNKSLKVYTSNYDFDPNVSKETVRLLKLHGTIHVDVSDGHNSRLIVTQEDYRQTEDYRDLLYDSMKRDLVEGNMIIVGHSLSDHNIQNLVNKALDLSKEYMNNGSVYLFIYDEDEERAELFEKRGIKTCFGGIDDLLDALKPVATTTESKGKDKRKPSLMSHSQSTITTDVFRSRTISPDITLMYNGSPASYADIRAGFTFLRTIATKIEGQVLNDEFIATTILGVGGVGKTTAGRQVLSQLVDRGYEAWEHNSEFTLSPSDWLKTAATLQDTQKKGVLLVDDCHIHLYELGKLFDGLLAKELTSLHIIMATSPSRWHPRVKPPIILINSKFHKLEKMNSLEIDRLIDLTQVCQPIRRLAASEFLDFSQQEQKRRLLNRCERDMFVCLRNIFANERFDDIILREYSELSSDLQEIYKLVSVLEDLGIRVHRQLVMRLLSVDPNDLSYYLDSLAGLVREYTIDEKLGIFGWTGRHPTISEIISKHKFPLQQDLYELLVDVISNTNPSYPVEVRSLRELASIDTGIRRITNLEKQNRLLARMISIAPSERIPRHRMVRNLIEMREFGRADAEIRMFKKDFREDGPIFRYRIILKLERARSTDWLMDKDKVSILSEARDLAITGMNRYKENKHIIATYCDVGIEYFRQSGDSSWFDEAISKLKAAEKRLADPDIANQIAKYEQDFANSSTRRKKSW